MSETQLIPFSEVQAMAATVARSGYFPAFGSPEKALTLMLVAQAEGCHPMQAVQRYDVISGKPAKKSDAMLADFQAKGGRVTWLQLDETAVEASFEAPGLGAPVKIRWTIEMAKRAGLVSKGTWTSYPRAMLRARVVSEGIRTAMPGVVAGLYTPEEVADFDAKPEPQKSESVRVIDVTPEPAATAPVDDAKEKSQKVRALAIAIKEAGIPEPERKTWMAAQLGKPVESSKDLSIADLDKLAELVKSFVIPQEDGQ